MLILFATAAAAYRCLAEIRRQTTTMVWDIRVRNHSAGAALVVPTPVWETEWLVREIVEQHGGTAVADERSANRRD